MGAWIETYEYQIQTRNQSSLPIWERGLKLRDMLLKQQQVQSLPIWERGLKLESIYDDTNNLIVAPYMGACSAK